jgi:CHAD domain-containing protein
MAARLPSDLLRRSGEEGARVVALAYLGEIDSAVRRLADPLDGDALHDFRVGLRRLRSSTRAYRPQLKGSVSKKMRRRLRDLTMATNPGRDIEVQLAWLHRQAERLGTGEMEGLAWLIGRLEGRRSEMLDRVTTEVAGDFSKAAPKLRRRLGRFRVEVRTGREPKQASFGQVSGRLVRGQVAELAEGLKAVSTPDDVAKAHAARIRAKRLRYLLEPLASRVRGVRVLVGRLKQLQDLLGHLHDMHVMVAEINSAIEALSRNLADRPIAAEAGLLALRRLANQEAGQVFDAFRAAWADGRAARFLNRTNELGNHLEKPPGIETARPVSRQATPTAAKAQPVAPATEERAEPGAGGHHDGNRLALTRPSNVG